MSVGDVTSMEKGSGARFNDGKPDYSLIFLDMLPIPKDENLKLMLVSIGGFQRTGEFIALSTAYEYALAYAGEDEVREETFMDDVVRVWEHGKAKYKAFNWAKGMPWSVPMGCIGRHYMAIHRGEHSDPESGFLHVSHIICNLQMLLLFHEFYGDLNDLPYTHIEGGLHETA